MRKLLAAMAIMVAAQIAPAQYYRLNVDLQDVASQKVIDRVFTGNTIGLQAMFYDGETAFPMTNWSTVFEYRYSQYDTNGAVRVAGVASSNTVLFRSTTNLFFSENDNYFFSIFGVNTNGDKRTFARGRMIEEYDPATAGSSGFLSNGQWYVGWANIYGDPSVNTALVAYLESTAGADTQARSTAAVALATATIASNTAFAAYGMASNQPPTASVFIWTDAATNYYMKSADGSLDATNTSFSALLNSGLTPEWSGAAIELGPTRCADGSYVGFEIDAPITNAAGWHGATIRGRGNYGTTIAPKAGYTGEMFAITGATGIVRFENIRFQGGMDGLSENTNTVLSLVDGGEFNLQNCEFGYFRGTAIRYVHNATGGGAWNGIRNCWFLGNRTLSGLPLISLEQTNATYTVDFPVSESHFYIHTNAPAMSVSGMFNRVQIVNNDIGYSGVLSATGIVFRGAANNAIIGINSFTHNANGGCFVAFDNATSNDCRALIVGNNTAGGATTNIIYGSTNSHSIVLQENRCGVGQTMTLGENIGGYVLDGYGTTASSAYRGDFGAGASNTAWQAWTNSLTNAAQAAAHFNDDGAHGLDILRETLDETAALAVSTRLGFMEPYHVAPAANIVINPSNGVLQDCDASGVVVTQLTLMQMPTNLSVNMVFYLFSTNSVLVTNPVISSGTWSSSEVNPIFYQRPPLSTTATARIQR